MTKQPGAKSPQVSTNEAALLAEDLRDVVSRFVRAVREHSGTQSNAQTDTLAFLERTEPASIAALAASRSVTHQTMRLIVMKLVDQALLELVKDPKDGRAYLVHLTQAGRAQLKKDRTARTAWLTERVTSAMNENERRILQGAIAALNKLIEQPDV